MPDKSTKNCSAMYLDPFQRKKMVVMVKPVMVATSPCENERSSRCFFEKLTNTKERFFVVV